MELFLARIKVLLNHQSDLFQKSDLSPSEVLAEAIAQRPSARLSPNNIWHIGNVEPIDSAAVYFALGRTARSRQPVLDDETGDFVEAPFERAPYTHVVLDTRLEVAAIARKYDLSPSPGRLCTALAEVLAYSTFGRENVARFLCAPLSNPDRFLRDLRSAFAIKSFTVTFAPPNPFDVNRDFIQPMERLAREANGEQGRTTISGQALDPNPLEELTRSAAATGDDASARVVVEAGEPPVSRSLRGDAVLIGVESLATTEERAAVVAKLRAEYAEIRAARRDGTS